MQTILLIRHAKAGDREKWSGDDSLRPLTKDGLKQAQAIAERFGSMKIASIRSSPALRCVQTVEPLARRTGVKLQIDRSLMEGSPINLPDLKVSGAHALCAHGDNIPELLESLDLDCGECKKGSVWTLRRDAKGRIVESAYWSPT